MDRFLDSDFAAGDLSEISPRQPMSPAQLGDTVARLVWEGFSDFLVSPALAQILERRGVALSDGIPPRREAEEILIFHLWAHTQAIQLAFVRRIPEHLHRSVLDSLHHAVFEDMVANGTPRAQLPVFEQRVSARYSEYRGAADTSDERVGFAVLAHLGTGAGEGSEVDAGLLTERAMELAHPLKDYLGDVELSEE